MKKNVFTLFFALSLSTYLYSQVFVDFEDATKYALVSEGFNTVNPATVANTHKTDNSSDSVLHVLKDGAYGDQFARLDFSTPVAVPAGANKISFVIWSAQTAVTKVRVWIEYGNKVEGVENSISSGWTDSLTPGRWDTLSLDLIDATPIEFIYFRIGYYDASDLASAAADGDYWIDNVKFEKEELVLGDPIKTISCYKAKKDVPPTIDGIDLDDDFWKDIPWENIDVLTSGSNTGTNAFSAKFKTSWDSLNLYLLFDVKDSDPKPIGTSTQYWNCDGIEVYFDPRGKFIVDQRKQDWQHQIRVNYGAADNFLTGWEELLVAEEYMPFSKVINAGTSAGYMVEASIAWRSMYFWKDVTDSIEAKDSVKLNIKEGHIAGLGIAVNDGNATQTNRDGIIVWTRKKVGVGPYEASGAFGALKLEGVANASINEVKNTSALQIYPNPVKDMLTVSWMNNVKNAKVQIYDIVGHEVYNAQVLTNSIDVENLQQGIYFLKITTATNTTNTSKFIKD